LLNKEQQLALKNQLIMVSKNMLLERMDAHQNLLKSLRDSAKTDTKSTAGDKHETFKAQMHLEQEKLEHQGSEMLKQLSVVQQINCIINQKITQGSVIFTNQGNFFIGLPLGAITIGVETFFSLSAKAPIIAPFIKNFSETIEFNGKNYEIASHF